MPSTVTRLSLVSHGTTEAMRRARFHSDEPVDSGGLKRLEELTFDSDAEMTMIAPERRTRQTAAVLGVKGAIVADLADLDFGEWTGRTMDDLDESELLGWLTDTSTVPPCGESIDALFDRVGQWMNRVATERRRLLAVTHPAVVRAVVVTALDAPSSSFWRVDIPPATVTNLNFRGGRWTLRSAAEKIT
ncbi:histidine phosphatase family protein [Rhodococcus sp. PAMC28707]|uniref:histidine phosphatase family protein n=1 Tax=unclassified Rhodococcus (in: high G+C Gram-positive bacteria) TaxID=192944 RepID=UPI00109DAB38|nr:MULTISPECIES: histidine phosphatase family protein [unclassified Rhodococcus (in: high G+C Gram-positive bacteria)]QCB49567.1 histidine phosphatase family protein [Rhodococcus sp. PAMC28705]QCB58744.1 histidine phosphatase family protein [Rhodococcus sp. PAMC28707]